MATSAIHKKKDFRYEACVSSGSDGEVYAGRNREAYPSACRRRGKGKGGKSKLLEKTAFSGRERSRAAPLSTGGRTAPGRY